MVIVVVQCNSVTERLAISESILGLQFPRQSVKISKKFTLFNTKTGHESVFTHKFIHASLQLMWFS